jgi:hypothetical protein
MIVQKCPAAKPFRNKPFVHFYAIEQLMPSVGKGAHVFCPGQQAGSGDMGTAAHASSSAQNLSPTTILPSLMPLNLSSLTVAVNEIKAASQSTTARSSYVSMLSSGNSIIGPSSPTSTGINCTPALIPPSVPSTYLASPGHTASSASSVGSGSVITSVSQGKCKSSAIAPTTDSETGSSRKCA